jgi:hypothetical protein
MRSLAILVFLSGPLLGDVVVLKGGDRVTGRVVDKATHYEVTGENGLRTYLKEEVEKIITSPKELLGDSDKSFEEAKAEYLKSTQVSDPGEQSGLLKESLAKVKVAREAYASARELFPEDKYSELDQKIMQIMQLIRMVRGSMHTEATVRNSSLPSAPLPDRPTGTLAADDALLTLLDARLRSDPAKRSAAAASFRAQRGQSPDRYDMATAATLLLMRSDAEWGLQGPSAKALQDFFDKGFLKDPQKLTPARHLEAATYLAAHKAEFGGAGEAAILFALAHLASATPGPEREKVAKSMGFLVQNGRVGTAEGLAIHDLDGWITAGDFDLAVMAFIKDYRSNDTPLVRFVWSYALLRLVQQRHRGWDRPISAMETIQANEAPFRDHLAALQKSIKAVAVCNVCMGAGKLRCTNCHGQKETKFPCQRCKGKGYSISSLGAKVGCPACRNTGIERIVKCEKCKGGFNDCRQCDGKPHPAPSLEDICVPTECDFCEGRGLAFRGAYYPCHACMGLGQRLQPKADPTKVLR